MSGCDSQAHAVRILESTLGQGWEGNERPATDVAVKVMRFRVPVAMAKHYVFHPIGKRVGTDK